MALPCVCTIAIETYSKVSVGSPCVPRGAGGRRTVGNRCWRQPSGASRPTAVHRLATGVSSKLTWLYSLNGLLLPEILCKTPSCLRPVHSAQIVTGLLRLEMSNLTSESASHNSVLKQGLLTSQLPSPLVVDNHILASRYL